ncbi:MAG: hypothetical protein HY897_19680 [Deltaproteobacteria bacterium]|nr:hypothetical protein [Deltaproteobacteria bacterium]
MSSPTGKTGAWLFAAVTLACTAVLFVVAFKAPQAGDQMAYLPDTPEVKRFLEINRRYGNFNTVLIGVETENILAPKNLAKLKDLTDAIGKIAGLSWMSAITTVPEMRASEEGVVVSPLVAEIPKDDAAVAALKARILKTRQIVGELVSPDFSSALVPVTMYGDKVAEVYPKIEKLARDAASPDFKVYFHGAPAIDEYMRRGGEALKIPGIVAGVVFLFFLIIGVRPSRIPAWLLVVAPAAAAGMAAPVLLKMQASELSMASGLLAFVYGTMVVFSYPGPEDQKRLRSWRRTLLISSIALAVVFLSLIKSTVIPLRGLGVASAVACIAAGVLGPIAMRFGLVVTGWKRTDAADWRIFPGWKRVWMSVFIAPVAAGVLLATLSRPAAENDVATTFGPASEPARTIHFLDRRFGGSEYLTIVASGDFSHPGFLRALDDLAVAVRGVPGVAGVVSPTDVFKMVSEAMIGRYRIPDTINQMQALWFFLEGQAELSALLYQKEQGLIQIRLSPDGAKRPQELMDSIRKLTNSAPARVGHVDLREVSSAGAARLRERQLEQAGKAIRAILGAKAQASVREALASVVPLELSAVSQSPDFRLQAAFRERLSAVASRAFNDYLTGPAALMPVSPEQAADLSRALLQETGDPGIRGRAGVDALLKKWFPEDEMAMAKMSGALYDRALDSQDKVLAALLIEEFRAGGVEGVTATSEFVAALRDFVSPHVFVDAGRDNVRTESVTETKFELTGYPAIAPLVGSITYVDLFRFLHWTIVAALLLGALAVSVFRERPLVLFRLVVLVPLSGFSWLLCMLPAVGWALNVSSFVSVAVTIAASAGACITAVASRTKNRDLQMAVLLTGLPLVVMILGFQPVSVVMSTAVFGILGAAFGAAVVAAHFNGPDMENKEETR